MLWYNVLTAFRSSPGLRVTAAAFRLIVWDLAGNGTRFMRSSLERQG